MLIEWVPKTDNRSKMRGKRIKGMRIKYKDQWCEKDSEKQVWSRLRVTLIAMKRKDWHLLWKPLHIIKIKISLKTALLICMIFHLLWYLNIYMLYVISHEYSEYIKSIHSNDHTVRKHHKRNRTEILQDNGNNFNVQIWKLITGEKEEACW